jgi:hypothetical protein
VQTNPPLSSNIITPFLRLPDTENTLARMSYSTTRELKLEKLGHCERACGPHRMGCAGAPRRGRTGRGRRPTGGSMEPRGSSSAAMGRGEGSTWRASSRILAPGGRSGEAKGVVSGETRHDSRPQMLRLLRRPRRHGDSQPAGCTASNHPLTIRLDSVSGSAGRGRPMLRTMGLHSSSRASLARGVYNEERKT